jgi:hypothetical protein
MQLVDRVMALGAAARYAALAHAADIVTRRRPANPMFADSDRTISNPT